EADYNDNYKSQSNWLDADRVFWENVEIADLFHRSNNKLYIIHNKRDFGVTVRDVCSQILHSMNVINRMRDTANEKEAGKYYDKIISTRYKGREAPISKEDFIELLLKTKASDIIYVMGYVNDKPVAITTGSNIAKFEAVKLCYTDRRMFDFG